MIAMLISLELMLNSADLNFVIFNRYLFPGSMEGMMFALFAIAIAAAETAIAIAIIINIYRAAGHTEIREINKMRF
jgi:NADH-quinone oxidoreductase subunit K